MVSSVRLDGKYEVILQELSEKLSCKRSTVIKKALVEYYEDIIDQEFIEEYDKRRKKGEIKYHTSEEMMKLVDELKKDEEKQLS